MSLVVVVVVARSHSCCLLVQLAAGLRVDDINRLQFVVRKADGFCPNIGWVKGRIRQYSVSHNPYHVIHWLVPPPTNTGRNHGNLHPPAHNLNLIQRCQCHNWQQLCLQNVSYLFVYLSIISLRFSVFFSFFVLYCSNYCNAFVIDICVLWHLCITRLLT